MKPKHENFLQFNGTNIIYVNIDGTYWIALRPICEALKIDVRRSREMAKKDPILGPAVSVQALQVTKNGLSQVRKMTCIPERFIYGWIYSLRSDSEELIKYKATCYDLIYDHFHGIITNRKELLIQRSQLDHQIAKAKDQLRTEDAQYKHLMELLNQAPLGIGVQ